MLAHSFANHALIQLRSKLYPIINNSLPSVHSGIIRGINNRLLHQQRMAYDQKQDSKNSSLVHSIHNFAGHLYRVTAAEASEFSNMVISPFSVYIALLMAAKGARGSTLEEIERTLRLNIKDIQWQHDMKKLLDKNFVFQEQVEALSPTLPAAKHMRSDFNSTKYSIVEMANTIWTSKDAEFKPEYLNSISEIFKTKAHSVDFKNPDAVRHLINQHVASATHGQITEILPEGSLDIYSLMVLVNALYFKGPWYKPFVAKKTRVEPFWIDKDRSVNVPMMHLSDDFKVGTFDDLQATAILLLYRDNRHGLLCVLPNEKSGLNETENRLFANGYTPSELLSQMSCRPVVLTLPKFKSVFNSEIMNVLQSMGVVSLFDNNANLSGISSSKLKVSKVYHQSTIEVDESGTEATAATAMVSRGLICSNVKPRNIEFRADHPFLFYLVDLQNDGIPLFIGRLSDPSTNLTKV